MNVDDVDCDHTNDDDDVAYDDHDEPECHFRTINRVAPKTTGSVVFFPHETARGKKKNGLAESLRGEWVKRRFPARGWVPRWFTWGTLL